MKKIFTMGILLIGSYIYAQSGGNGTEEENFIPQITPPSPTAYALGNYGNTPVGLFTGSPSVSVPLLMYKTNHITVPISLFYGSNGIKVDDVSTNVGLGWNLNFGGVITRTVRDRADETSTHIIPPENVTGGYTNPVTNQFLHTIVNGSPSLDTEADVYSFNFNGNSGKFFYDLNNQPHIVDQQAIKIERIGSATGDGQDFLLTLPAGEKYYFEAKERSTLRTSGSGDGSANPISSSITAWYLTKIIHPKGDEIYFIYSDAPLLSYITSQAQVLKMSVGFPYAQPSCQGSGYIKAPALAPITDNNMDLNGKRIQTITSNNPNFGTIAFTYESDYTSQDIEGNARITNIRQTDRNGTTVENIVLNYLNTVNKRNFLSSVIFKDPTKVYSFDYESPTQFPVRLSFSQDRWGYYNGKFNTNLVPANIPDHNLKNYNYGGANKDPDPNFAKIGMLKRITYPTKGYTDLEYEGNTYWGEKTIYPVVTTKNLSIKNTISVDDFVSTSFTFTSPVTQTVNISGSAVFNTQCSDQTHPPVGLIHGANFYKMMQGSPTPVGSNYQFLGNEEVFFEAAAGQTYTITIDAGRCTYTRASINYYATAPQVITTNLDTGGIRIKSTKDIDSPTSQNLYKRYYYAHKDALNHSSGKEGNNPYYTDIVKWQVKCPATGSLECSFVENSAVVLTASSIIPLYNTETSSCLYPYVTISEGGDQFEEGGEMKEFKIRRDNAGSSVWGSRGKSSTPWSNKGWDNGTELKSTILRKNASSLEIIQEKENVYEKNDTYTFELKNFVGRQLFNIACPTGYDSHPYTCTAVDVSAPNNKCTGLSAGTTVSLLQLDNFSVTDYRLISSWHYLKSQKTTEYLNGTPVATQTEFFYNNPVHYQLNKQKTTFPDGTIDETNYSYAHEKANQKLINANMIGIPLETSTVHKKDANDVSGKLISKSETKYDNPANLFPTSVLSYDLQNPTVSSTEVTYDKYDSKGNLQQYTAKNGISTTIIWGYNQTQPIAKIEGAKLSDISQSAIDAIVNASINDAQLNTEASEQSLISALDLFRNNSALSTYQITTYTYDPLIGVRSITPPSGIRELYKYDTANRLEKVIDINGKVLKEFKYNYKN